MPSLRRALYLRISPPLDLRGILILRAGELADRATLFRTDLAFAQNPTQLVNYPHRLMSYIDAPVQVAVDVALGAQEQIASFFASDGRLIIRPEPAQFFEVPVALPLPEDVFFLQ